ncbi:hypothetical protein V8D89_000145 [Ganoderma adspersum]
MFLQPLLPSWPASRCLEHLASWCYTLYLFTQSDIKTIVIPTVLFGTVAARGEAMHLIVARTIWVWCNLLQVDVANQSLHPDEDKINKPWRPIPDGRIQQTHARALRWFLLPACLALSVLFRVPAAGAILTIANLCYHELGLDSHWFTKNLCNAVGYSCFNAGASSVMGARLLVLPLNMEFMSAHLVNVLIILTTIHAQDFQDIEGDRASGRVSLPIAYPSVSRASMAILLPGWSMVIALISGLRPLAFAGLVLLGASVGAMFYMNTTQRCARDKVAYRAYNLWLCGVLIAPFS